MTPHVAQKKYSAIDQRTTRHAGYAMRSKKRKLVEEIFGWSKTIGALRGPGESARAGHFTFAAYNLARTATIFGWRLSTVWWVNSGQSGWKGLKVPKIGLKSG